MISVGYELTMRGSHMQRDAFLKQGCPQLGL